MISIPNKCKFIFETLENNGFECFAVGGCVRDSLRGVEPQDWDFTTNATPDELLSIFSEYKTVDIGKSFGTICVISQGVSFEITTYRTEGDYSDSRHPDSVVFSNDICDDLSRRDFTMNSIAYNYKMGLVDPFGGFDDIRNGIIRCTGVPVERFSEDALRIIRALRFSSVLGFSIEKNTSEAIFECKERLCQVHPHRIRKELSQLICGKNAHLVLYEYKDVISIIIPEIKDMFYCDQHNPHHIFNVLEHTLKALEYCPQDEVLRLSVFFHDIGKPYMKTTDEKGIDHFKKHPAKSAEIAEKILKRFGFPSNVLSDVITLVRYHDERFRKKSEDIKRVLNVTGERLFFKLFEISSCDIMAQSDYQRTEKLEYLKKVEQEARRILKNGECYSLKRLAVRGNDLITLGYEGEQIGFLLNELLKMVIKGKVKNEKADLIDMVQKIQM